MKALLKKMIALVLVIVLVASLAACGSSSSSSGSSTSDSSTSSTSSSGDSSSATELSSSEPQYGGSATLYCAELTNLFAPEMDELNVYALWFESLWAIDWSINDSDVASYSSTYINYTQVAGQIADTWEVADDYSSLTVTIRDDIYFQTLDEEYDYYGGRQLTASDVKYSYDRLLGIGSGFTEPIESTSSSDWTTRLYMLESVEVVDDLTVVFNFNTTSEVALDAFMTLFVNIAGPEWDELTEDQQSDWHYACGTGPYILTDYMADDHATFTKNENYYDYDERYPENKLPYLDTVELVYIEDSATLVAQFIAGNLDYIGWATSLLSASEIAQIEDSLDSSEYIKTDFSNAPSGIGLRMDQEPFSDIRVRQALQMAINIEEINYDYYGYTSEPVIPGLWSVDTEWSAIDTWSDELMAEYTYDPEGAKELLAEAGYEDGFEFTVTLNAAVCDTTLYELVKSYFAAIGVTMNIESVPSSAELNQIILDEDSTSAFFQTGGNFTQLLIPSMVLMPDDGFWYDNDEFVALASEVLTAESLEEQIEIANEMDLIFSEEHWVILLGGTTKQTEFMSTSLGGYTGEKLRANSNYRTIVARLWSTGG